VTGGFLYAMAIVFAGRGVAELQEAGLVSLTPVEWAPRIETLGVFPTVESLALQAVFVLLQKHPIFLFQLSMLVEIDDRLDSYFWLSYRSILNVINLLQLPRI
jgi:hypothetical protein